MKVPDFRIKQNVRDGPEAKIQEAIRKKLLLMEWYVQVMHGNIFQFGFPDLFCAHKNYGIRLVEVKNPANYSFTAAQLETFPKLMAHGVGVWILTSDEDAELNKLFGPPNWYVYLDTKMMRK